VDNDSLNITHGKIEGWALEIHQRMNSGKQKLLVIDKDE